MRGVIGRELVSFLSAAGFSLRLRAGGGGERREFERDGRDGHARVAQRESERTKAPFSGSVFMEETHFY
jgi:hypothetical protein